MAHTPGPWTIHGWGEDNYEVNAADETVCNVPGFDDETVDSDRAEANARLIAAAPDLLHALHGVLHWAECECKRLADDTPARDEPPLCDFCVARAAIAKAEGRAE